MSLTPTQVAALRELDVVLRDTKAVIIGASALGFYYDMHWRQTADVDLVVAMELECFPGALLERTGWSRHPNRKHEFTSPAGTRLDLLPAGPGLLKAGEIKWKTGHVMNLTGMELAFAHAEPRQLSDGHVAWVAPPTVVAVLKMVAYCDRPDDRERDLEDLAHLLESYVEAIDDRRWHEAAEQHFDLAPAYLMGLDIGRLVKTDSLRQSVEEFLSLVSDPESWRHALMQRKGPRSWRQDDALERRLRAFKDGQAAGRGAMKS